MKIFTCSILSDIPLLPVIVVIICLFVYSPNAGNRTNKIKRRIFFRCFFFFFVVLFFVFNRFLFPLGGLEGCAVASWLVRRNLRDRGHCVVFLGKTLYSHSASLHPGL